MMMNPILYKEEQAFRQPWLWTCVLGTSVVVLGVLAFTISQEPPPGAALLLPVAIAVLIGLGVPWLLWAMRLTVLVEPGHLHVRFFPFRCRDIRLSKVARWQVRNYRPILEYGGWGIRYSLTGSGWAYNVSGNRGVQLEFTDGNRLLIGSQHPEELAGALERARAQEANAG
jgi:hypothetical protein